MPYDKYDTSAIYTLAGPSAEGRNPQEKHLHMRQFYLTQIRASNRQEETDKMLESIENVLTNGSIEDILALQRDRHEWRTIAHNERQDQYPICENPECTNICVHGSNFCPNHILLDPNQKLFVECPNCHSPKPVNSNCFRCLQ